MHILTLRAKQSINPGIVRRASEKNGNIRIYQQEFFEKYMIQLCEKI
jgi:hypothetical protein